MLKQLTVETVHGLIGLVDAEKQVQKLCPPTGISLSQRINEYIRPSSPISHAHRTLEASIVKIVQGLTIEQQAELVALMWLGRDGGDASDWGQLLTLGRSEARGEQSNTPVYVTDKADLDDYLEAGLQALGFPRLRGGKPQQEEESSVG